MLQLRPSAAGAALRLRAAVLSAIRQYFKVHGYLEVETPLRIPAPTPETHVDAQPSGAWYLHTSPELCMKRLLAAGFPRIFQICKAFRQGERGCRHLPEMTLLEWYTAGQDYTHMMSQCESLITFVAGQLGLEGRLRYQGRSIDLNLPWPRLTVAQAFSSIGGADVGEALDQDRFDEIMGVTIEPSLGWQLPVFLYDYPAQCSALARLKAGRPDVAERFELYIGGLELCNAFSELTDPEEQRRRFEMENERRRILGKPVYPMPEQFLNALPAMPFATGNALGIDRLVMLLADKKVIDEVVAFTPEEL